MELEGMSVDISSVLDQFVVVFELIEVDSLVIQASDHLLLGSDALLLVIHQIVQHVGCLLEVGHLSFGSRDHVLVLDQ